MVIRESTTHESANSQESVGNAIVYWSVWGLTEGVLLAIAIICWFQVDSSVPAPSQSWPSLGWSGAVIVTFGVLAMWFASRLLDRALARFKRAPNPTVDPDAKVTPKELTP